MSDRPDDLDLEHAWSEAGKALGRAISLTIAAAASVGSGPSPGLLGLTDQYSHLPLTMKVDEAAKVLGTSRGTVYEMIRRGDLFALRLGRRLIVPRRAIVELLEGTPPP